MSHQKEALNLHKNLQEMLHEIDLEVEKTGKDRNQLIQKKVMELRAKQAASLAVFRKKVFKFLSVVLFCALLGTAIIGVYEHRNISKKISNYKNFCKLLKPGYLLSHIESEAKKNGFLFFSDRDDEYRIKPYKDWPDAYACAMRTSHGEITSFIFR